MANDWAALIQQLASKYGVDPQAALAVASVEGLSGGVGDGGHAFGPFQMNDAGGVLTGRLGSSQERQAYAESPKGIDEAMRSIAEVAKGLKGKSAIENIVRRYERPKDPASEVARALAAYGKVSGGAAPAVPGTKDAQVSVPENVASAASSVAGGQAPQVPGMDPKAMTRQLLLGTLLQNVQGGGGQGINVGNLLAQFSQIQKLVGSQQAPQAQAEAQKTGGTLDPPVSKTTGEIPGTTGGSALSQKVLKFANAQIGQPYVWGGESRSEGGFDCSGLVDAAYRAAGINLPGRLTTYSALKLGKSVKGQNYLPGDMVVTNGGEHMVMYAGDGKVIAAPHTGAVVRYQPLSDFAGSIVDVRRILKG